MKCQLQLLAPTEHEMIYIVIRIEILTRRRLCFVSDLQMTTLFLLYMSTWLLYEAFSNEI